MPVILEQKDWNKWLDLNSSYEELNKLYTPLESDMVNIEEVNDLVNSVKNDSIECIQKSTKVKLVQNSLF